MRAIMENIINERARSASGRYKENRRDPLGGNESRESKHMPRQNYVNFTQDLGHMELDQELPANVSRIYRHQRLSGHDHTSHRTL